MQSYNYRDFASVPDDGHGRIVNGPMQTQKLPTKLHSILSREEFSAIISWMPHGRSFKIHNSRLFSEVVMPQYFDNFNYKSFTRLINAWSFRRISRGPSQGSYYHELFLQGKPHLQRYMRRLPKTAKKLAMDKDDEPDFQKMSALVIQKSKEGAALGSQHETGTIAKMDHSASISDSQRSYLSTRMQLLRAELLQDHLQPKVVCADANMDLVRASLDLYQQKLEKDKLALYAERRQAYHSMPLFPSTAGGKYMLGTSSVMRTIAPRLA